MSAEELLQVTDDELKEMEELLGKTEKETRDCVNIIRSWIKQNPHLPDVETDARLRKFIQLNKYHIEKTKFKLDNYYTLRNFIPEIYRNREPNHSSIQNLLKVIAYIPLPKLTDDYGRVCLFKFLDTDPTKFNPNDFFKFNFTLADVRITHDRCLGDQFIFDLAGTKLQHFMKITPMMLKQSQTIIDKALTDRLQGLHYINAPPYASAIISFSKTLFKEKVAKRIHIHHDLSTLYDHIPRRILPSDYKGEEKSVKELQDLWKKFLAKNNDWFLKEGRASSNEKLRMSRIDENDLLGFQGSFRKLEID